MSKYKVGDKVVFTVTGTNGMGYLPFYVLNDDFIVGEKEIDKYSELLSTYTEQLEAKIRRQAEEITRLLAEIVKLKEDFKDIEPLEAKIKRQAKEITRLLMENKELKEENKELFCKVDSYELYGDQHEEEYNQAFNQGAEAAWELAKKINDMDIYDTEEIFIEAGAFHLGNVLENYTYPEAAAKVTEWEKAKEEIKRGDIIRNKNNTSSKFCVTDIDDDGILYGVGRDGATYSYEDPEYWEKTGRHIDIHGFLKQIGGENNGREIDDR